jgi:hypothetical protein
MCVYIYIYTYILPKSTFKGSFSGVILKRTYSTFVEYLQIQPCLFHLKLTASSAEGYKFHKNLGTGSKSYAAAG